MRVTVPWQPGQTRLGVLDRQPVDRMILSTWGGGLRVVLAVYGKAGRRARDRPGDADDYCTFVASLLHRYPGVSDVVIWNEPNSSRFWRPQFAPGRDEPRAGRLRGAARAVLGRAPRGAPGRERDRRLLPARQRQPVRLLQRRPLARQLLPQARPGVPRRAAAAQPIFDTVGHNPYPVTNAERPVDAGTRPTTTIAEGDYDKLMAVLQRGVRRHRPAPPGPEAREHLVHGTGLPDDDRPGEGGALPRHRDRSGRCFRRSSRARRRRLTARPRARPGDAALRRAPVRLLPARRRRLLQLRARRRAEPRRLAVRTPLDRHDARSRRTRPFRDAVRRVAAGNVDCARYAKLSAESSPDIGFTTPARQRTTSEPSSSVPAVIVRSLEEAEAFTTADGSTIRELLGLPTAPVRNQSLAEATLEPGQSTQRHYHREAEEIYYVVEGSGEMELDGEPRADRRRRRGADPARRLARDHAPARTGAASSAAAPRRTGTRTPTSTSLPRCASRSASSSSPSTATSPR